MDLEKLRNWKWEGAPQSYEAKDTILYALSLGLGANPLDPDELRFLMEDNLLALPTLGAVINRLPLRQCLLETGISSLDVFHGEQRSQFDRPLPPAGIVGARGRVIGVWDKGPGRGALIEMFQELYEPATSMRYCSLRSLVFARGEGGFGGDSDGSPKLEPVPDSPPEACLDIPTLPQTALIYRLTGDRNPIHSDPLTARRAGLPRPILHGYCTYGMTGWAIMKSYLDCNAAGLSSLDCRFSGIVFPGETLRVEMWRVGHRIAFQVRVLERDTLAISNGSANIKN